MAELLRGQNKWYSEIQPSSFMNEGELENAVETYLAQHLHDYYVIPFKKGITHGDTLQVNKPDLAIIKKDYSSWFIVEVELSTHHFNHIDEQVNTFKNGIYNLDHANYIYSKNKSELDLQKLNSMVSEIHPRIMVIVNEKKCEWIDKLNKLDCKLGIFQIYYNKKQKRIFRFDGYFPGLKQEFAYCRLESGLPQTLKILNNTFLDKHGVKDGETILCSYEGKFSKFEKKTSGSNVFLIGDEIYLNPIRKRYMIIYNKNEDVYSIELG